jgi:hypothetical protein
MRSLEGGIRNETLRRKKQERGTKKEKAGMRSLEGGIRNEMLRRKKQE